MRLDKYVRVALQVSRNEGRVAIKNKKIKVNGNVITKNDYFLNESDVVTYLDQPLIYKEYIYLMMNKPKGYICATEDNTHKVVLELINDYNINDLIIVGRLDIDTEGLLIITNDGVLCHQLTSPKKDCPKEYYVETDFEFTDEDVKTFKEGTTIFETVDKPYKCKSAILKIDKINKKNATIEITEGKYHQVKKMCKSVGKTVKYLKRLRVNKLFLDNALKPGEYRELTEEEVEFLK